MAVLGINYTEFQCPKWDEEDCFDPDECTHEGSQGGQATYESVYLYIYDENARPHAMSVLADNRKGMKGRLVFSSGDAVADFQAACLYACRIGDNVICSSSVDNFIGDGSLYDWSEDHDLSWGLQRSGAEKVFLGESRVKELIMMFPEIFESTETKNDIKDWWR